MADEDDLGFTPDEIGEWSERKIEIATKYAKEFSKIVGSNRFRTHYIDGFCGGGFHLRKETQERIRGTAVRIVEEVSPPFEKYHLVDADLEKASAMAKRLSGRPNIKVYPGDANLVLLNEVFPAIQWSNYDRALCFLDPYRILLNWGVLVHAGRSRAMDVILHFPTGDVQRNVLRRNRSIVSPSDIERMNTMWGDGSWENVAYREVQTLFGSELEKEPIQNILDAFCVRLEKEACFKFVSKPLAMKNKTNATIYHLIFASQKDVALKIADYIFEANRYPRLNV